MTVPEQAHVDYDPLVDRLTVVFGEADAVDIEESVEDIWMEFDADELGRCTRVEVRGPSFARTEGWMRILADIVGPSVIETWVREKRRQGRLEALAVDLGPDRDVLGAVWLTLHTTALGADAPYPTQPALDATTRSRARARLGEWLRQSFGFPLAGFAPLTVATRGDVGKSDGPTVVNVMVAGDTAEALGVGPVAVLTLQGRELEVRLTVTVATDWFLARIGADAVEPPCALSRFVQSSEGYVSARLRVLGEVRSSGRLVARFVDLEGESGRGDRS